MRNDDDEQEDSHDGNAAKQNFQHAGKDQFWGVPRSGVVQVHVTCTSNKSKEAAESKRELFLIYIN